MAAAAAGLRVVIAPGMGCTPTMKVNWYPWLHRNLVAKGVTCIGTELVSNSAPQTLNLHPELSVTVSAEEFPDPYECKESIWLEFMRETLKVDENTILVGHSTGSEAVLRYGFLN